MPKRESSSAGFAFFSSSAQRRRRRRWFVAIVLVIALALIWPVYPTVGAASPLILGLPPSLVWVVGGLCVVFAALVWLYRSEEA